jgi:tRNA A37 threonylcarbamoyladenosine modification protein TsaB
MQILAVTTATQKGRIAFVKDDKLVSEKSWKSKYNESEKLLPEIQKIIKNREKIDKILVIQGPGPFTALRVSIAVVNAMAYALNVPVIPLPVKDYWKARFKGEIVLSSGGDRVFYKGNLMPFDNFLGAADKSLKYSGELGKNQIQEIKKRGFNWTDEDDLATFGETILEIAKGGFKGFKEKDMARPLYYAPPHITKSKKSYK